ncbi:MAG: YdiU family protein, partial [Acidimicrobiales bacterium]|nr:YdiU family protein [Acidimicrobiales bacterium]
NTDNTTISGETIDYGPCAFLDRHDPAAVFSSIDHAGRYAFGNQPRIAQWNLARLAEAMLGLLADDQDEAIERATAVLDTFPERFRTAYVATMRPKLGLAGADDGDADLVDDLLAVMHAQEMDHTATFRALSSVVRGDDAPLRSLAADPSALDAWLERHRARRADDDRAAEVAAADMDRTNPLSIPRNHLVETALDAAVAGDLGPFAELVDVVTHPFEARPGHEPYTRPAPPDAAPHVTYCGT